MFTSDLRVPQLVSCQWLAKNLEHVKIIECSHSPLPQKVPLRNQFVLKRIPGAVFYDLVSSCAQPGSASLIQTIDGVDPPFAHPHHGMMSSPFKFAKIMTCLGISEKDPVVIYERVLGCYGAARLYFEFRSFAGWDTANVGVLDGGFSEWLKLNLPVQSGDGAAMSQSCASFKPVFHPVLPARVINKEQFKKHLAAGSVIIDTRSPESFAGQQPEKSNSALPRGHIAGAKSLPFMSIYQKGSRKLLPEAELRDLVLKTAGELSVDKEKDIVVYCSLGFTACGAVFVLSLLGFKNVFMYNGSYVEWAQFKEPVVCQFVEEAPLPRL